MDMNEDNDNIEQQPEEPREGPPETPQPEAPTPPQPAAAAAEGAGPAPEAEHARAVTEHHRRSRIREDLEAIILAIIFVIVIRQYVAEAYKIPTGSMEPTLMGNSNGRENGDNIIVDKMYYWFNPVQRWDVVVFKFPEAYKMPIDGSYDLDGNGDPRNPGMEDGNSNGGKQGKGRYVYFHRNFIKRCVALPGEAIWIKRGDIYITNDSGLNNEIPEKPPQVQEALWQRVYFCDFNSSKPFNEQWRIKNEAGMATRQGRLSADASAGNEIALELSRIMDYRIGENNEQIATDRNEYGKNYVGDIMIETAATFGDKDSSLVLEIVEDDCIYTVSLGPAGSTVSWLLGGETTDARAVTEKVDFTFAPGVEHKIRFINVDDRLSLVVDGKTAWGVHHFAKNEVPVISRHGAGNAAAAIRITRGKMTFGSLNIYRDIYYTSHGEQYKYAVNAPYHVPEGCYFAMGDNSPISSDSRVWGTFPREYLIGKACFVFFPFYPVVDVAKKKIEWRSRLKLIR